MISGTFHPSAQEWRYFSREKALIHTLHLGQLPASTPGNSVFIQAVPPSGTHSGRNINVPSITPWGGGNSFLLPTGTECYAYYNKQQGVSEFSLSKNASVAFDSSSGTVSIQVQLAGMYQVDAYTMFDDGGTPFTISDSSTSFFNKFTGFKLNSGGNLIGENLYCPLPENYDLDYPCFNPVPGTMYAYEYMNSWSGLYRLDAGASLTLTLVNPSSHTAEAIQFSVCYFAA